LSRFIHVFVAVVALLSCPSDGSAKLDGTTQLRRTIDELAAIGPKRSGTEGAARAAELLRERMIVAGAEDVHFETFAFPRHDVRGSTLGARIGSGTLKAIEHDVLDGSGSGEITGPLAWAGDATKPGDLRGRVALVVRNPVFHRSTQYSNVAAAGATGMIYVSSAPEDLRQVGSVRRGWEAMGPIPAVTIAQSDGKRLQAALASGTQVEIALRVHAQVVPAVGRNVVGRLAGREPGVIVIGAHYDSWFAGSTDNGAGVAAMLELLRRRSDTLPRYDLVFVAWDGEELALYGGYDYLRRHAREPVRAVIDLETPAARGAVMRGLAHSPSLDTALRSAELDRQYEGYMDIGMVPLVFGGVIPTDLQGAYRAGWPSVATAVDSPYYHTAADTPDKVDLPRLAQVVDGFDAALDEIGSSDEPDPALEPLAVELQPGRLTARASGPIDVTIFKDGFFPIAVRHGQGELTIDTAAGTFAHVSAGAPYPRAESVVNLQNAR
jgi:hypothetical protein